jgi:ABC-type lipoprotein release transport system permease subunit
MNLMLIKLGVRNVLRNKRRTFLTSLAIGVGLMQLIVGDGFMLGMKQYMIRSVTDDYLGHAQFHHKKFLTTNKIKYVLSQSAELESELSSDERIKVYGPRTHTPALIASAQGSSQVFLVGIDPKKEADLSRIKTFISQGAYLEDKDQSHILIGRKLAEKLKVEVGDKLVLTLSPIGGKELSQELFRIRGIYSFGSNTFDNQMAFIHLKRSRKMLGCKNCVHEIAVKFKELDKLSHLFAEFKKRYSHQERLFEDWKQLLPALDSALAMFDFSMYFLVIFLAILVGTTIVNTLYMALYERKFEFGVLAAIGTRKKVLFGVIIVESITLAVGSIFVGSILTFIFGGILAYWGIDYGGVTFASVPLREPIYMVFTLKQFILYPAGLILFTVLISIYPIWQLLRIPPSKSLKLM